jgi:hypothetical protein
MKTWAMLGISFSVLLTAPAVAHANGLALEIGLAWAAPQEPAYRAIEDEADTLTTVGLAGAWTLARVGDFRVDALAAWGVDGHTATIGDGEIQTDLLEHGFALGARLRWARLFFAQPYASLRAGPVFGWLDVQGEDRLEAFDVAMRVQPAAGVEAFLPWAGLDGRFPRAWSRVRTRSGWAGAGIGLGLEVGYRFQTPYDMNGTPPEPEDDDEAADAIPRAGARLGRLTLSGVHMGIHVTLRF